MTRKISARQILASLPDGDKLEFIDELLGAIEQAEAQKSHSPIQSCLDEWEATAELNMIPGLRQKVWENYRKVRKRLGYAGG